MNFFYKKIFLSPVIGLILTASFISPGCINNNGRAVNTNSLGLNPVNDADKLLIVDCLLPGRIRQLGTRLTTLTARRAVKTSGIDCERRGGEYVPAAQANYASALKVWQPLAEAGDVNAQTYVGEVHEKGMGKTPDYQQAKFWYIKAASQGDARAKTNLAFMHESGLGSQQNAQKAQDLYSDASRLGTQYSPQDQRPVPTLKPDKPPEKPSPPAKKPKQKPPKKTTPKQEPTAKSTAKQTKEKPSVKPKKDIAAATVAKETAVKAEKEAINRSENKDVAAKQDKESISGLNFGRYYAVVIGNSEYKEIPNLKNPASDASNVASLLKQRYGFKTAILKNASRGKMLKAFDSLRNRLTKRDNLLIYYSGHSRKAGGSCYWLPSNARANDRKSWISNTQVANFVDAMQAKHILVVADACYSGTLSQRAIPRVPASKRSSRQWYATVANTKVRVVLSSGATALQSGSFAPAFMKALRASGTVIEGARIYRRVKMAGGNSRVRFAPIRFAGHESGDFIFLKGGRVAFGGEEFPQDPQRPLPQMLAVLSPSLSSSKRDLGA